MKTLLTLTLFFTAFYANSQTSTTPYTPYYSVGEPWEFQNLNFNGNANFDKIQDSLIVLHNIKARKTFSKNKKGQTVMTANTIYNGKESQFEAYNLRSRKTNYKSYYKINNYRIYEWKNWGARQKQINEYVTINDKTYLKEKSNFKKDKLTSRRVYFWNQEGILDSMQFYSKREAISSLSTHYFYKNDKLAETKTYEKGKLTTIRKYDCTPLGEVQKKVKQTKSCVNTEFDAQGNKITVSEYTDEKGRVRKWKTTYVGDSKIVIRNEGFDHKNRPTYFRETTAEKHTYINYKTWGIGKGKELYKEIKFFDSKNNLIKSETYNKGKLQGSSTYLYDSNNQLISTKGFNKKGKEVSGKHYEYNNQGLKTKHTKKYKKNTYTSTFTYE